MLKNWNMFFYRVILSYTAAVVLLAVVFLASGAYLINCVFLLELLGLVVCCEIAEYLLSKIEFRSRTLYICVEFLLMYLCFLAFSYLGKWFGFNLSHLLLFSGMFIGLFLLLHLFDYLLLRTAAARINQKLKKE